MPVVSRSWLRRQLQHCGQDSGTPLLYREPESRPLAESSSPEGPGQPSFLATPFPGLGGPSVGFSVSKAVARAPSCQSWDLHLFCVPRATYTSLGRVAGEERTPHGPVKGQLAAKNVGGPLENVKQDEETGNYFLLGAKSCHPAHDLHLLGTSILLPPLHLLCTD